MQFDITALEALPAKDDEGGLLRGPQRCFLFFTWTTGPCVISI